MNQRSDAIDLFKTLFALIALLLLFCFIVPQLRPFALWIVGLVVLAGVGSAVIHYWPDGRTIAAQSPKPDQKTVAPRDPFKAAGATTSPCPKIPTVQPQNTEQLLKQLHEIDWFQFEKVIALTYGKLGYKVTRRGGANPDGGIDLVIEKDQEQIAVQCKHWKAWELRVRTVREFLGALTDSGLKKGLLVISCGYTGSAKHLAEKHNIQIVNEADIMRLLKEADASYDPDILALLNDTRKYCPKCESEMVLRKVRNGFGAGSKFWGCSRYPQCRYTMDVAESIRKPSPRKTSRTRSMLRSSPASTEFRL